MTGAATMAVEVERRRTPRVAVGAAHTVQIELRHRVQMVDISQSGALFICELRLPVGARAQLRTGLGAAPFATEVVVRRHDERPATERRAAHRGRSFATMDEGSRRGLEQFLRRASE